MDDVKDFQSWLFEPVSSLGDGVTLMRNRRTDELAVKKTAPEELRPVIEKLRPLDCPYLPKILWVGDSDGSGFFDILEEYIPGGTLRDALSSGPAMTDVQTAALGLDICAALGALHRLTPPVIHRDIKPENIIVSTSGRNVLIDFDAARLFSDQAAHDTVELGTHGYAAPEQYGFAQSGVRSDIYALGVTMYEARAGKPFETGARLPGRLGKTIEGCTRFDFMRRFDSVGAVSRSLKRAMLLKRLIRPLAYFGAGAAAATLILFFALRGASAPSGHGGAQIDAAAGGSETACTCKLFSGNTSETDGLIFTPDQPVWNYAQGDVISVPVTFYWGRDESGCQAKVHDEADVGLSLIGFDPFEGSTGATFSVDDFSEGILTVKEAGSYHIYASTVYHGKNYSGTFYVEVPDDHHMNSIRPCTCSLITEDNDGRAHGVPLRQHPFFTFAPVTDTIDALPYRASLELLFPRYDWECKTRMHTGQSWTLTLDETKGAYIEDGFITITKAGTYHIRYEGEFNGAAYSGVFEITAPSY